MTPASTTDETLGFSGPMWVVASTVSAPSIKLSPILPWNAAAALLSPPLKRSNLLPKVVFTLVSTPA